MTGLFFEIRDFYLFAELKLKLTGKVLDKGFGTFRLLVLCLFISNSAKFLNAKGDTLFLSGKNISTNWKFPRDAEITMQNMVKFRCRLLGLDSKFCILKYHTGVKAKNISKGPEIEYNRDTSLGKYIFVVPLSEIRIISIWKFRTSGLAELPFGICAVGVPVMTIATLSSSIGPPGWIATGTMLAGAGFGIWLQHRKKYFVQDALLIRVRKSKRPGG